MSELQFIFLFIGIMLNAYGVIKIAHNNKVDIAVIKKDIHYMRLEIQRIKNFLRIDNFKHENHKPK